MKNYWTILFLLAISCSEKPDATKLIKPGKEGAVMPTFTMLLMDSITPFTNHNLQTGKPTFFMYMSPTCPYCKMETRRIINNIEKMKEFQFVFFTDKKRLSNLKKFSYKFNINKYPNISLVIDTGHGLINHFQPPTYPFSIVYDKQQKLKQMYLGAMSRKAILEATKI